MPNRSKPERNKLIVELYQSEDELLSIRDVAARVDVGVSTVYKVLKDKGVLRSKSEAQKKALETGKASLPPLESIVSEEAQIKKSKSMKKAWENKSEEEKARLAKLSKDQWHSRTPDEQREFDRAAAKGRLKAAKEGSRIELGVGEQLEKAGFICLLHRKDILPNDNLEIDIYVPEQNCVIEIDGPGHFLPIWGQDKLEKQQRADREKNAHVINHGLYMVRVKYLSKTWTKADEISISEQLIEVLNKIKDNPESIKDKLIRLETNSG